MVAEARVEALPRISASHLDEGFPDELLSFNKPHWGVCQLYSVVRLMARSMLEP